VPGLAVVVTGLVAGLTLGTGVLAQPLGKRIGSAAGGPVGLLIGAAGFGLSLVGVGHDAWGLLVPVAVLLGTAYGLCLAAGLTMVAQLAAPTARGALTGTFYACAYLGFGVPLLLSAIGGADGFGRPLGWLAAVVAVVGLVLALPAARRLVRPHPASVGPVPPGPG
jgi:MFS family permease